MAIFTGAERKKSVIVGLLLLCSGLQATVAQEIPEQKKVPKLAEPGELKLAKVSLHQVRDKLNKENRYRRLAEQKFASINSFFTTWNAGTHPAYTLCDAALKIVSSYSVEKKKFDAALADFNAEKASFEAIPITDENRASMNAWKERLLEKQARGNEWRDRLEVQKADAIKAVNDAQSRADSAMVNWRSELVKFQDYAYAATRIGELDAKIVALDKKIKLDRTALDRWQRQLPGFYDDVEGMAKEAERTRKENSSSAVGLGFSLAADATVMNNLAKEKVLREQVRRVKVTLVTGGIRPQHVKQLLSGWESTGSVKSMRSAREMIETLSQLMDLATALDIADKHKYWEALAACLSIFVQHPVLKLIKTNVEVYTNLLHTGLAYGTARARVKQFSQLSDSQLHAVDQVTKLAVKNIRARAKLVKEKSSLEIQLGWAP